MQMKFRTIVLVSCLAVTAGSAMAQNNRGGSYLGVKGGLYFPSNGEIRDIFGSSIFVFGISADDFSRQPDKWRLTGNFDFISGTKDNDKFFAAPVTASVGRVFGAPGDRMRPFVRFGVGGAYFDYSITRPSTGERFSTKRFGFTADAEAGVFLSDRVRVSAKYVWFSKVDDFDFSGFQLTATVNLFRF
jgi:opacity protein-like surface antigen